MDRDIKQLLVEIQAQVAHAQTGINMIAAHQSVLLELLILAQKDADKLDTQKIFKELRRDIFDLSNQLNQSPSLIDVSLAIHQILENGKKE